MQHKYVPNYVQSIQQLKKALQIVINPSEYDHAQRGGSGGGGHESTRPKQMKPTKRIKMVRPPKENMKPKSRRIDGVVAGILVSNMNSSSAKIPI